MKKIIKAMSISFVEDYESFRNSMDTVNEDLQKCKIPYQYSYDEFCIDYMKETKRNMNFIVYFGEEHIDLTGCWQFNLFNLRSMIKRKLDKLGYEFHEFYELSVLKTNILPEYQGLI